MDNELSKLRIDRSAKTSEKNGSSMIRILVFAVAAIIISAICIYLYLSLEQPLEVEITRVRAASDSTSGIGSEGGEIILNATGYIIAAHKIELASKVNGKVAWIGVNKGDKVKQGQQLVRLEDEEYRSRVIEAEGQLNMAKARLAALVNGSRPEEIDRSKADVEQVRADLNNARISLERTKKLVQDGILSKQAQDDAQARYDGQIARSSAFDKSRQLVQIGPRREDIDAARAQVKQLEGSLLFAKTQLENTIIRSPINGVILGRNVEIGEFVTTGFSGEGGAKGYVVSLADLNDLQVELDIPQTDFAKLGPKQSGIITTDTYQDKKYQGFIEEVSPEANRQKATVQVKVKVSSPDDFLRPEMNANVAFYNPVANAQEKKSTPKANPIITIPSSAVKDNKIFVIVDGKAVQKSVQTAGVAPQGIKISQGLMGGEDLIVNPPTDLKDGQKVRAK